MWSLKPFKSPPSECPVCSHQNYGFQSYFFVGAQILGQGNCANCGIGYYHNWPVGHGVDFPVSFGNGQARYSSKAEQWLAKPLIKAVKQGQHSSPPVNRQIRSEISEAVLFNCLDSCYGHIVLKIFNTWFYRHLTKPKGMVVIVPANCAWMVPEFVAEIWTVDIALRDINTRLDSVKDFVSKMSENFKSISLLKLNTHPDHQHIDFSHYFRVAPFRLEDFDRRNFQLSFIWREDRWWIRNRVEEIMSFISIKYSLGWMKRWLIWRQRRAIINVGRLIRRQLPEAKIKVIGLGGQGRFPRYFDDLRELRLTEEQEINWCRIYAESQLVVGVHGSGLLIPTALSAGFIELLPRHKIPFISEDTLLRHPPRFQTFLGRHLDLFTSPKKVARHIISMAKDFPYLYQHASQHHE